MANQELLNKFYFIEKELKENQHKCMKLTKEEIVILTKALTLLEDTSITEAEKQRQNKVKSINEYISNNPI